MGTLNYPAWGSGIRYDYDIFRQVITKNNPWEIMKLDTQFK